MPQTEGLLLDNIESPQSRRLCRLDSSPCVLKGSLLGFLHTFEQKGAESPLPLNVSE